MTAFLAFLGFARGIVVALVVVVRALPRPPRRAFLVVAFALAWGRRFAMCRPRRLTGAAIDGSGGDGLGSCFAGTMASSLSDRAGTRSLLLQPGHATKRPANAGPTRRDFAQFEHCTRIMDFAKGKAPPS